MQSQPQMTVQSQTEPKKGVKKGTPEGDRMVHVRVMKPCTYGPTAALEKRYEVGEELYIPAWRYTSYHDPEEIKGKDGKAIMTVRGCFELADRPRPIEDNVGKHPEDVRSLIEQNEEMRKRLAILESGMQPGAPKGKRQEI